MSLGRARAGLVVVPGEKVGVVEEFSAGDGTYEAGGTIFSQRVGRVQVDMGSRMVRVQPLRERVLTPMPGDIVIAQITLAQEKAASARIVKVGERLFTIPFTGVLHISNAGQRYVRRLQDIYKPRDIIRARVSSIMNATYHLSTAERGLGAILSYCSICGGTLRRGRGTLKCSDCGNEERRKVALDYGELMPPEGSA